jgi:hypothetical protein
MAFRLSVSSLNSSSSALLIPSSHLESILLKTFQMPSNFQKLKFKFDWKALDFLIDVRQWRLQASRTILSWGCMATKVVFTLPATTYLIWRCGEDPCLRCHDHPAVITTSWPHMLTFSTIMRQQYTTRLSCTINLIHHIVMSLHCTHPRSLMTRANSSFSILVDDRRQQCEICL